MKINKNKNHPTPPSSTTQTHSTTSIHQQNHFNAYLCMPERLNRGMEVRLGLMLHTTTKEQTSFVIHRHHLNSYKGVPNH